MKRAIVQIDLLVLQGLGSGSSEAIARDLQQQLVATLSAPGCVDAWTGSGCLTRLSVGQVAMSSDSTLTEVGRSLAHAIGRGVVR